MTGACLFKSCAVELGAVAQIVTLTANAHTHRFI